MRSVRKFIALATVMALCGSQVQGQEYGYQGQHYCETPFVEESAAYSDCERAPCLSAAVPIAAIFVAAIIIAANRGGSHHHHSGGGQHRSSSSSRSSGSSSSSYVHSR